MASPIAHQRLTTRAVTAGVKYSPSAVPITHCPPLRSGTQLSVGRPVIDIRAVATSGPIIHGSGVRSTTQASAAASANNKVRTTRRKKCRRMRQGSAARSMAG